ncbi:MAG: hypothetical protein K2K81_09970 [Muribaculaceae bacterium]|nr:hypothetical protein [Muribaculaceae bacterium]
MKRINHILATFIALIAISFSGCTDDISLPASGAEEMFDGIVLRIPDPKGMTETVTRAQSNAEKIDLLEKEGTITSLHFFAFRPSNDGVSSDKIYVNLMGLQDEDSIDLPVHKDNAAEYTNFNITSAFKNGEGSIKNGTWKFYIIANLERYGVDASKISTEKDLLEAPLNFFKGTGKDAEYLLSQEDIKSGVGLPMACMADAVQVKVDGDNEYKSGQVTIPSSGKAEIHADLSFLCSKVRYTVFFDKTVNPAKDIFKDLSFNLSKVDAENVMPGGTTIGSDNTSSQTGKKTLENLVRNECKYPDNADVYPEEGEEFESLAIEENPRMDKRAWQGVVYLPENASENRTTLKCHAKAVKGDGSDGSNLEYAIPLLPVSEGPTDIERGYAYDIVAKVTKIDNLELISFKPQYWTTKTLEYALKAPVFLHIGEDQTVIPVTAGKKTHIWYDSNADISFDIPKYKVNGVDIPIYTITKTDNSISVGVNSSLPTDTFDDIMSDAQLGNYNFFHIVAGNIQKKIDVEPLKLSRFLIVDPLNFTIDVREQRSGGNYSGEFFVNIETNIEKFEITDISWLKASPFTNLKVYINKTDGGWEELNLNDSYKPIDGKRQLRIAYDNVNSGESFWNKRQDLSFKVSVDDTEILPQTVTTYIRPENENYIIHFRDNKGWSNVHIYVYQCLEIPSHWNYTCSGKNLASMPVGYDDQSDGSSKISAALEYSFTGAIAFKGWDSPSNRQSLNETLRADQTGWYDQGFWIFSDGWFKDYDGSDKRQCSWNPYHAESDARYEKGALVDFCGDYRQTISKCENCKKGTGNALWPGIRMEEEGDGWWKFELSGIATPGKTLIMFTDGHSYDEFKVKYKTGDNYAYYIDENNKGRYPDDLKVGVPLFNYPSREGWFDLDHNNNTFVSSKPDDNGGDDPITPEPTKCKFYVENKTGYNNLYIYGWDVYDTKIFGGFPGKSADRTEKINGTDYQVFEFDKIDGQFNLMFSDGGDTNKYQQLYLWLNQDYYIYAGGVDDTSVMHRLFVKNNTGWKLRVYSWGNGEAFGTWDTTKKRPGEKVTVNGVEYEMFLFKETGTDTSHLIFFDNDADQTNRLGHDFVLNKDYYIELETNSVSLKASKRKRQRK